MLRHAFALADIDYEQWLTLTRVMLKIDLRGSGGLNLNVGSGDSSQRKAMVMMAVFYLVIGLFMGFAIFIPDPFVAATLIFTVIMFLVGSMVLIEYQSVVISPDDYGILAYRPISSRTYFAAKLTNVMVYLGALCGLLGLPSVVMFGLRHGPAVGLAAGVALCGVGAWVGLAMIVAYAWVLRFVHPKRLRRVLSYLQMLISVVVYGGYVILPEVIDPDALINAHFDKTFWLLLYPPTWFASFLALANGNVGATEIVPALGAAASIAALLWYATGRLSLSYAERISLLETTGEVTPASADAPPAGAAGGVGSGVAVAPVRSWSLLRGETRAVALLVRAQFRFDMKFRMSVLGILPITGLYVYMSLRDGPLSDPFVDSGFGATSNLGLLHMVVMFMPAMLLLNLSGSDSFRAAWIFHATPADKARLVVQTKNLVMVCFVLPYLAFVGAIFAYYFGDWRHAVIHVAVIGLFSSLVAQIGVLLRPQLPFAKPVQKGRRSGAMFITVFGAMIFTLAILPAILWFAYSGLGRIVLLVAILVSANLILGRWAGRRARMVTDRLEFAG